MSWFCPLFTKIFSTTTQRFNALFTRQSKTAVAIFHRWSSYRPVIEFIFYLQIFYTQKLPMAFPTSLGKILLLFFLSYLLSMTSAQNRRSRSRRPTFGGSNKVNIPFVRAESVSVSFEYVQGAKRFVYVSATHIPLN